MVGISEDIKFEGRILDNVHGFIYYTKTEEKIINTLLFKRLQSIKQLSIANWVFPGSEHTRFIHSLGVMFVADKIAQKLKLSVEDRKIVRLAGLLHDIGHYPLSHVCEYPYKESPESFPDEKYCQKVNAKVKRQVESFEINSKMTFMKKSTGYHHEKIGADIVQNNQEIRELIIDECGPEAPEIIADMIVGNVERQQTNPLLVQILHAELDADGIDYLMRDAMFSGTSFGAFELDQLIGCMETCTYKGKEILCITPKGIAAADQYLMNKFFSYSQVVFNKHISITEWMAEQIVDWMQKNNAYFPRNTVLRSWIANQSINEKYVDFTDNYFWTSLQNILQNPLADTEPQFIKYFCSELLRHNELPYEENSEVKIISDDSKKIREVLMGSNTYQRLDSWTNRITVFSNRSMSKQIPQKEFDEVIRQKIREGNKQPDASDNITEDDIPMLQRNRLMECICVKDGSDMHLLCDDPRSLMQSIYNMHLVILRAFECNPPEELM